MILPFLRVNDILINAKLHCIHTHVYSNILIKNADVNNSLNLRKTKKGFILNEYVSCKSTKGTLLVSISSHFWNFFFGDDNVFNFSCIIFWVLLLVSIRFQFQTKMFSYIFKQYDLCFVSLMKNFDKITSHRFNKYTVLWASYYTLSNGNIFLMFLMLLTSFYTPLG